MLRISVGESGLKSSNGTDQKTLSVYSGELRRIPGGAGSSYLV